MKRLFGISVFVAVALVISFSLAQAVPINPINTRPVVVGSPPAGESSLQTILDTIYGVPGKVSAANDQQTAGMWKLISQGQIAPLMRFEFAGSAASNTFGIWTGANTGGPLTTKDIFLGGATGQNNGGITGAVVIWTTPTSGFVNSSIPGDPRIAVGAFSGIPFADFGFYMGGPGTGAGVDGKFWTVDQLNPGGPGAGTAQALAYTDEGLPGGSNTWTIAFEDVSLLAGADGDHNDLVVSIESIVPVPEPISLVLLGSGLLGAGLYRRLRKPKG